MQENTKRLVAGAIIAAAVAVLIWGTYLPYRKSKLYVKAIGEGSQATSLDGFSVPYMIALNAPSPIGQDEAARNFASTLGGIVSNAGKTNSDVVRAIGLLMDQYTLPVMERRSALSSSQMFYVTGIAYRNLFDATGDEVYRERSRAILLKGLELSLDRPQLLYSLFDDARFSGDEEGKQKYGKRIMELWPSDNRIPEIMEAGDEE
jgi:hypothetical protein